MYLLGLSANLWQGINDRGLDIVGKRVYEQLAHGARAGIRWLGAEYAACTSVAAFGNCLSEGLQLNNGGRKSFCLDRFPCSCQIVVLMLPGNAKAFEVGSCDRLV